MSKVFDNCRLDYCHFAEPRMNTLKGKEEYSALLKIPNTEENRQMIEDELADTIEYGKTKKFPEMARITPMVKHAEDLVTPDGQWIQINLDSVKPFKIFNMYGEEVEHCDVRRVTNAQIEMFGFAWSMAQMKKWGVKLYTKAIAIFDDMEAEPQEEKFAFKKRVGEVPPAAVNNAAKVVCNEDIDEDEIPFRSVDNTPKRRTLKR